MEDEHESCVKILRGLHRSSVFSFRFHAQARSLQKEKEGQGGEKGEEDREDGKMERVAEDDNKNRMLIFVGHAIKP